MFGKCQKDVRYSVRILIRLYIEQKPLNSNTISKFENISRKYVMKLLFYLKEKNLVKTIRGRNGGYSLVKDLKDIHLIDVIKAFNYETEIVRCPKNCPNYETCKAKNFWKWLNNHFFKLLSKITIKDIVDGNFKDLLSF